MTLTIAAIAGLLLAGCSWQSAPDAPVPETETLSASEAGGIYLEAVCPVNASWDAADVELERLKLTVSRGDDDTARFAAAMNEVAAASKLAVKELDPKTLDAEGHAWPAAAKDDIAAVRKTLSDDQKQAARVAKLTASEVLSYSWQGADEVGAAASAARESLGLPADGQSACEQWQEQIEAEKAAAEQAKAEETAADKGDKAADGTPDKKPGNTTDDKTGAKQ